MNIPNIITLLRIILIPVLVIFLMEGKILAALIVFLIAGLTDALDGFIARLFNQKTHFGAFIDPIADKMLLITSYITLSIYSLLPSWLTVLVVSRDIIILTGIAILMLNNKPLEIKPRLMSKVTTFFQILTVCLFLLLPLLENNPTTASQIMVFLTAGLTVVSGIEYIMVGFIILGKENGTENNA